MDLPAFSMGNLRPEAEEVTVFLCGKCRLPVGDSSDWDNRVCNDGVLYLKAISDNVSSDNESVLSSFPNETGCVFQNLQCKGCLSPVGRIYLSAPRGQDTKIEVFALNISALAMYALGSARKQVLAPCDAPVTLEKCHIFEDEIKKCKQVLGVLQRKVRDLESKLPHSPYEEEDNS